MFVASASAVEATELAGHEPAPTVEVSNSPTGVVLSWHTSDPVVSYLTWGRDGHFDGISYVAYGHDHEITMEDLECDAVYVATAWLFPGDGRLEVLRTTFGGPLCPSHAPEPAPTTVDDVRIVSTTKTAAIVTVATNNPTTVVVGLRSDGAPERSFTSEHDDTSHVLQLDGLGCGIDHEISVTAIDDEGARISLPPAAFRTLTCTTAMASAPRIVVTDNDVEVAWTSDLASTGRLQAFADGTLVERAATSQFGGTEHVASIPALECDTVYEIVVVNDTIDLTRTRSRPYEFTTASCVGRETVRPLRVMAVGDELTEGSGRTATYRRPLWQALEESGADVEFVGTRHGHRWSDFQDANFDQHHVAVSGADAAAAIALVVDAAPLLRPDIVLLNVGTNDVRAGRPASAIADDIGAAVARVQASVPTAQVYVGTVLGCSTCGVDEDAYAALNAELAARATEWSTETSAVVLVDLGADFDHDTHTFDGLLPNEAGDRVIADAWYEAMSPAIDAD